MSEVTVRFFVLKDRIPTPATLDEWAESMGDVQSRSVGRHDVGEYVISTIFLGLESSLHSLFETRVFDDVRRVDWVTENAETWEDAVAAHSRALEACLKGASFEASLAIIDEALRAKLGAE